MKKVFSRTRIIVTLVLVVGAGSLLLYRYYPILLWRLDGVVQWTRMREGKIPEVIRASNDYISKKVGKEFFDKYIRYNPSRSNLAQDGSIYYLVYNVNIPLEKPSKDGIDFRIRISQTVIRLQINKDLSLRNPAQISELQDCSDINKCLKFFDINKAISVARADMEKVGYKAKEVVFNYNFSSEEWDIQYDLPQEKTPQCFFKMGGTVYISFNAFEDKVSERREGCYVPQI